MKCQNCGFEAQENDKFCRNCGNELIEIKIENNEEEPLEAEVIDGEFEGNTVEEKKKFFDDPKKVTILGAILFFHLFIFSIIPGGAVVAGLIAPISIPCSMAGLAFIIYAKVHFPGYKPAKVLFWIMIIIAILFMVLIIWLMIACIQACANCNLNGFKVVFPL